MSDVFVVTRGSYSDYRIVGVFSTRELAQEFMTRVPADGYDGYNNIEVYKLDAVLPQLREGLTLWIVTMGRDGTVERLESKALEPYGVTEATTELKIWRRSIAPAYRGKGIGDALNGWVLAKDAVHATKIANDRRLALIASGEWDKSK